MKKIKCEFCGCDWALMMSRGIFYYDEKTKQHCVEVELACNSCGQIRIRQYAIEVMQDGRT